ncbi:hematopoietic death receptor isoform X5 [Syngnathus typhle]|uniref:hematopoietic death receptor isoform X5 n=1 Tax=Syngnathus typhle TaxID=161592 RepID=UPI002A6B29AF|nr:hematopoietic death receptor isoform X5 [Syngnathus typhle]
MNRFPFVISILIGLFASTASFPWADLDLYIRTQREVRCKDEEYRSGNICCLKCPAGTHLKSACTTPGEVGQCEECEDGTHTQHANDFTRCSRCTLCRSDQVIFRPCSHTQDAECHCKAGGFCDPEEACETCIKCSSCEKDKEVVRNCTATSNTECKEIPTQSNSSSGIVEGAAASTLAPLSLQTRTPNTTHTYHLFTCAIAIIVSVLVLGIVGACIFCCMKKRARGSVGNESKAEEDEPFPELIPVNGVDSLRKCFEYFEEVDIDYYKRFFRELDLHGNVIRSKDQLTYEDRIHELLNIWVEKEGKDASLNDLLKALLKFDQRRTAETIKEKALENGHYVLASKSF